MFFCVCTGIILGLRLFPDMEFHSWDFFFLCMFLFLILCLIMLKAIIKDAEEDLSALLKLKDKFETHLENLDAK